MVRFLIPSTPEQRRKERFARIAESRRAARAARDARRLAETVLEQPDTRSWAECFVETMGQIYLAPSVWRLVMRNGRVDSWKLRKAADGLIQLADALDDDRAKAAKPAQQASAYHERATEALGLLAYGPPPIGE